MNTSEFLRLLWTDQVPGVLQLCSFNPFEPVYLTSPEEADRFAGESDVYTRVTTLERALGPGRRGGVDEAHALAGLWLDIDVQEPNKPGGFPDRTAAIEFAHTFAPPSLVIGSGLGVQPWWLLEAPWTFNGNGDRDHAQGLAQAWGELYQRAARERDRKLDPAFDLARLLRLPGTVNMKRDEAAPVEVVECEGARYDIAELVELCRPARRRTAQRQPHEAPERTELDREAFEQLLAADPKFAATWRHERDDDLRDTSMSGFDLALSSIAGHADWSDEQLAALIRAHREHYEPGGNKQQRADYVARTITKARAGGDEQRPQPTADAAPGQAAATNGEPTPAQNDPARPESDPAPLTDLGNADRLIARHGDDLIYVPGLGWHAWDGCRWARDRDGALVRCCKDTIRALRTDAATLGSDGDRLWKHANASESRPRIEAAIALAQSDLAVAATPDDLDADPYLLNVANGTLELRDGNVVLREHRRDDRLSKITDVSYVHGAQHPEWDRFVERATGGDDELAAFIQRAAGYSLTGSTSEEAFFFAHGPTATSKSTFLETLRRVFGEYAATADFDTFLKRRGDPGIRNDIARLAGARMVVSVEVDEGKHLAEGLLKVLTGGDTISARFLYGEAFEFAPQLKLWLAANHRPAVNADDAAMWRRIVQVPFTVAIPGDELDPGLKRRFLTDPDIHTAVLAWAVEGCRAWQRDGLNVPDVVRDYTEQYRDENDPIADWLADCCRLEPGATETPKALGESYEHYAERNGDKPITRTALGNALRGKGVTADKVRGVRVRRGIRLQEGKGT